MKKKKEDFTIADMLRPFSTPGDHAIVTPELAREMGIDTDELEVEEDEEEPDTSGDK